MVLFVALVTWSIQDLFACEQTETQGFAQMDKWSVLFNSTLKCKRISNMLFYERDSIKGVHPNWKLSLFTCHKTVLYLAPSTCSSEHNLHYQKFLFF